MTVKYPQVPEDLKALSDEDLKTLRAGLAEPIQLVTDGKVSLASADDKEALGVATKGLVEVKAEQARRKSEAEADAQRLADAAAALEDDAPEDEPEDDDPDEVDEPEDDEPEAGAVETVLPAATF